MLVGAKKANVRNAPPPASSVRHAMQLKRAIAIAALLLGGCTRATSPGPDADLVIGHWEWAASCCSIAGAERSPATEGDTYVLQFSADGTVEVVRNNALIFTTRFTVTRSQPAPLADPIVTVHYDKPLPHGPAIPSADQQVVSKLGNGTLLLQNPQCADCYGEWRFLPRLS